MTMVIKDWSSLRHLAIRLVLTPPSSYLTILGLTFTLKLFLAHMCLSPELAGSAGCLDATTESIIRLTKKQV